MQLEATGKSVEIAIQNGLLECGLKREEVDVKVIEEGGLFKKAKVILTWGEEKQEETFNVLAYHEQMRIAANRIGTEYNALVDKMEEINAKYKVEPSDAKARKLAEEHKKLLAKSNELDKERNYFLQKFHETSSRAVALDNELTEALIKQGYKIGKDGKARKGEAYRQTPIAKTRVGR